MFNPEKDDYPQNAAGQPEFATAILHLDGITETAPGDIVVHKMVYSTEDLIASVTSLASYFGEPEMFANPSNARLLAEAGRCADPAFIYVTPRAGTVLIAMSTPTWDGLVQHPSFGKGSSLLTMEKLVEIAADQQGRLAQFAGGFANLLLLDFSRENIAEESQEPNTAQSLADSADIEEVEQA